MRNVLALFFLVLLCACSVDHGTFTVLSNKIVNVKKFDVSRTDRIKNVVGDDKSQTIIIFPTKQNPNLSGALNEAFKKTDGDVMTDVTVKSYEWYIPYIYGERGWVVEGDVLKTRDH